MLILSDDAESSNYPVINYFLIGLNTIIFCWTLQQCASGGPEHFYSQYGSIPARLVAQHDLPQYITVLSAMFVHAGLLHFVGNMWALYLFGDNVEDRLGHFTYLVFYLSCGIFAEVAYIYFNQSSVMPSVGASGAIAGVMAAYLFFFPEAKCKVWWGDNCFWLAFRTYMVPSLLVIAGWFVIQVLFASVVSKFGITGGIAYHAHVGGFICGLVIALLFSGLQGIFGKNPDAAAYADNGGKFGLAGACLSLIAVGVVAFYPAFHTEPALASSTIKTEQSKAKKPAVPGPATRVSLRYSVPLGRSGDFRTASPAHTVHHTHKRHQ